MRDAAFIGMAKRLQDLEFQVNHNTTILAGQLEIVHSRITVYEDVFLASGWRQRLKSALQLIFTPARLIRSLNDQHAAFIAEAKEHRAKAATKNNPHANGKIQVIKPEQLGGIMQ